MKNIQWNTRLHLVGFFTMVLVLGFTTLALAAGDGGGGNHWLKTDTYKTINFVLLVVALFFVARKPVSNFFSSRTKEIEEKLADLEAQKTAAEKKLADYQARFKNLDEESKQIVKDYIKQGEAAKERILAEAQAQADKLEEVAKRNIEQEFKAAKASLKIQISQMAIEKAETLIKESISSSDQEKLVDDYLKKVVA
jgi:F-type H+-transporting ATPase subunit b